MSYITDKYGASSAPKSALAVGGSNAKAQSSPNAFFSNIGKSIAGVGNSLKSEGIEMLSQNSLAKIPQVIRSIKETGFSMGPINIQGKSAGISAQLARRSSDTLKRLQAGIIDKKQFDSEMKTINDGFEELRKKGAVSAEALKDASQYGRQFANNAKIGTILATGVEQVAGKTVASSAGKEAIQGAFSNGIGGLAKGVAAEAGLPGFVTRQAVNQGGGALRGVAGFVGRTGMNLLDTTSFTTPDAIKPGNIAFSATSLIPGGPLRAVSAAAGGTGKLIKNTLYDSQGLFDMVQLKGGQTVNQAYKALREADPAIAIKAEKVLKQVQDYNLRSFKGDKQAAADFLTEYIGKKNLKNISIDDFVKEQKRFIEADRSIQNLPKKLKKGEEIVFSDGRTASGSELDKLGAVKSSQSEVSGLVKLLKESKTSIEAGDAVNKFVGTNPRFISNKQNQRIIDDILNAGKFGDEAAVLAKTNLVGTNKLFIKQADGTLKAVELPGGYYMGVRPGARFANAADTAALEQGNKAPLSAIGKTLEKAGISTQEPTGLASVYRKIKGDFVERVPSVSGKSGNIPGDEIWTKLEGATSKTGVTDIRQLRAKEIEEILGTSLTDSKNILKEAKKSFSSQPLSSRGLAGKMQDLNLEKNPLAAPYSRAQGTFRYEKNPFFGLQERVETRLGVGGLTGARPKLGDDYTQTRNILKNEGILSAGFAGEAANEGTARISSKLKRDQERTLAAGFEALAANSKQGIKEFINDPKNAGLVDNMKAIVQYPEKGLTSSNFMKALNLALFPTRYNIKVTQLAYKALAKRPGIEQVAVIKGLSDYMKFTESEEGIKWQSENSEALGLLRYFTPVGSVESIVRTLRGKNQNLKDLGSIGGLPFGVISQVLQGQGVFKADSPYLDPKTGEVVPDKIPQDIKARAEQALTDIVGTLYIYPGRLAGGKDVPSKSEITKTLVNTATFGALKGGKYDSVDRGDLTPEQQRTQRVLRAGASSSTPTNTSATYSTSVPARKSLAIPQKRIVMPKSNTGATKRAKNKAVRIGQPF